MLIQSRDSGFIHPDSSEITPRGVYEGRRDMLRWLATGVAGAAMASWASRDALAEATGPGKLPPLRGAPSAVPGAQTMEKLTEYKDATSYNNYYEFGTDKGDPVKNAGTLKTRPWTVEVEGLVNKPGKFGIEDLIKLSAQEERIYRLRCVEGWSMVIPWVGIPLSAVLDDVQPNSKAKFVEFTSLKDPKRFPGQQRNVLDWPYVEGLRMDEAMHPLTILAVGLYGETLPNQDGAPVRLVVPWKYGFKGIKAIVNIKLVDYQPTSSWTKAAPNEYGFYSNVNPEVDHPRWSQAKERRIGEFTKRPTLMFNGYGDQVASLYTGMNLKKNY